MDNQNKFIFLKDYSPIKDELKELIAKEPEVIDFLKNVNLTENTIYELPNWESPKKAEIAVIDNLRGNNWYTQEYIGILQFQGKDTDVTISIGSRFDDDEKNSFFTNYIFSKALELRGLLLFQDMQPGVELAQTLEQLMAVVFVNQVKVAQKHGLFRMYRNFERNDAKVRGTIDVARHINSSPLFNGKIAYSYREYTADNDINRIIFTVFSMLEKKYKLLMKNLLNSNRNVKDCMNRLGNIVRPLSRQELQKLLKQRKQKIHHSVYKDWEAVRKTAIMILRHMGVTIAQSDQNAINGLLVNMTEMWELYLESILEGAVGKTSLKPYAQNSYDVLLDNAESARRSFRPDFCWIDEKEDVHFIADAKYKNNWERAAKMEMELIDCGHKHKWSMHISEDDCSRCQEKDDCRFNVREDVFQVMSYMYTLDCHHGAIICPVKVSSEKFENIAKKDFGHRSFHVSGKKRDDEFHLFALAIPQNCKDYTEFKAKMKLSEDAFRQALSDKLSQSAEN